MSTPRHFHGAGEIAVTIGRGVPETETDGVEPVCTKKDQNIAGLFIGGENRAAGS